MLILSRGVGETVLVGEYVEMTPTQFRCGEESLDFSQVRLGFRAPRDVTILRSEVPLRATGPGGHGGSPRIPRRPLPGYTTEVHDVLVRLRIAHPAGQPIHLHRRNRIHSGCRSPFATFPSPAAAVDADSAGQPPLTHDIDCGKDDTILVGDVTILIVDVRRFVRTDVPARPR